MRKSILTLSFLTILFSLTSCDLIDGDDNKGEKVEYNDELNSSTGKWYLLDENKKASDTYFEFDGTKNKMNFKYFEDGLEKYFGSYRCIYEPNDGNNTYTLNFIFTRNGQPVDDWVYTYVDDFESDFTQFTTIKEEKPEGINDGRIYSHIYRISELPYKLGTYVLEGKAFKKEKDNYKYANRYQIPQGSYKFDNSSFTFVMPKPYSYALFKYNSGDDVVEGVYWTATDKKTIYLYIDHNPYEYIRKEDRENFDMTFSHDYPPDFYLRGNFEFLNDSFTINDLYHHEYSQTNIQDAVWKLGTYTKI